MILIVLLQVLERAIRIVDTLHLMSIVCVFDQAIYSKACQIKWKEPEKFQSCLLMMGIFHTIMIFMQVLFKRFGDAGMKDVLIQSSVIAEGSIESALRGKCYNKGIRLYKIFYEDLLRQMMSRVIEKVNQSEVEKLKQELSKYNVFTNDLCKNIKDNVQFEKVLNVFIDLKSEWSSEKKLRSLPRND